MAKSKNKRQPLVRFLFLAYSIVMLWLLFDRPQSWDPSLSYRQMLASNMNLTPLLTIKNYWYVVRHGTDANLVRHCIINLAGNVVLFIPIGFWLVRIWPRFRNFFLFVLTCTGAVVLVETLQLFTLLGSFDVDDVILNLLGMTIGYLFGLLRRKK